MKFPKSAQPLTKKPLYEQIQLCYLQQNPEANPKY